MGVPKLPPAPGPGPSTSKSNTSSPRGVSLLPTADVTPGSSVNFGKPTDVNVGAYLPYMRGNGVNSDFDIDTQRGQNQKWYEQAGRAVGNLAANSLIGIGEAFGTVLDPNILMGTIGASDNDYSNAFIKSMQDMRDPFGQIYKEHPNEQIGLASLTDPGWWFDNAKSVGEWLIPFMGEEKAFAFAFTKAAKAAGEIATLGKLGIEGKRIATGVAHVMTAATQAYTEGAQSAAQIYQETYKNQKQKYLLQGMTPEEADTEARHDGSKAGATTIRMNTAMNTLLNMGEVMPLFKQPTDEALHWFKTIGKRAEGESLGAWKARLAEASTSSPEISKMLGLRKGINSRAAEIVKEGVEEVNTQYAEAEGRRTGASGKERNILAALTDVERYIGDVSNQEGALNFVLGAFGGAAFTTLIDHMPGRYTTYNRNNEQIVKKGADGKVAYNADGSPKYEQFLVSPKTYTERGTKQYFENIKDAIVTDITRQEDLHRKLLQATADKNTAEVERLKGEIFSINAIDGVSKGMTENWQEQYKQIAKLDNTKDLGEEMQSQIDESARNILQMREQGTGTEEAEAAHAKLIELQISLNGVTEAMQKGFATSMKDHIYKETANRAVEDLKYMQDVHDTIQKKYVDGDNPASGELADHLFFRTANLYLQKRGLEKVEAELNKQEALESASLPAAGFHDSMISKHNDLVNVWNGIIDNMNDDIKKLQSGNPEDIKQLIAKYRAKGIAEDDTAGAVEDLVKKIRGKQEQYKISVANSKTALETSTGFTEWKEKHPDKTFDDYTQTVGNNAMLQQERKNLEYVRAQHEIAAQNLQELTTDKGIREIYKGLAEDRKKLLQSINARNKNSNVEKFLAQQTKEAAARLDVEQRTTLVNQYEARLVQLKKEYNETEKKREEAEQKLKDYLKGKGVLTNLNKTIPLRQEISMLKQKASSLEAQIKTTEHQLELLQINKLSAEARHEQVVEKQESVDQTEDTTEEEYQGDDTPFMETEEMQHGEETPESLLNFEDKPLYEKYVDLASKLSPAAREALDKVEAAHKPGQAYSIDRVQNALKAVIGEKAMQQIVAQNLHPYFRAYLKEKEAPVVPAKVIEGSGNIDIEAKKADIEKRRQEELEKIATDIFPDTKVKQVVYHGNRSGEKIEKFKFIGIDKLAQNIKAENNTGIFFTDDPFIAATYGDGTYEGNYKVVLNIKNPAYPNTETVTSGSVGKYIGKNDAVIGQEPDHPGTNIVVFEPEQIHILTQEELNKVDKINSEYDAELKALEQPIQSEIEAKKADIERRRQEELTELGQKQLTKGFNSLSEATKPEQVANAIVNIEQSKNKGALLSKEQEQTLSEARAKLKEQGYEIVDYNIVKYGENTIEQAVDFYDNEKDVLTEEQANAIESKINTLEKRGEEVNVDDLPSPVSRTIKPLIKKDGKMVQAAEVNTLIFKSVEQAKEAIKKSREAGNKKPNAADKINAKYDAELAALEQPKAGSVGVGGELADETTIPEVIENEQDLTADNSALFTDNELENLQWDNSSKTVDAVKGNSSDLQYKTITYNGQRKMRNVTVDGAPQIDPNTNVENLIPGFIQPGHQVYLEVDTNWNGSVRNTAELNQDENLDEIKLDDKFENYTDKSGKIRVAEHEAYIGYANMPIKIVDAVTGKTLKYFPRADWITETQGAENYRNVEDAPSNGEERVPGNVKLQEEINLRIRKRLAEMHNANPANAKLHTTITDVSGGQIMYHGDLNESTGKVKYRPQLAEKLLPASDLTLGVANSAGLMVGKGKTANETMLLVEHTPQEMKRLAGTPDAPRSSVVAFIPMNNGKHKAVPMLTVPLSKRPGEINTIVRVVELYFQHGTEHLDEKGQKLIDQIEKNTGFDVSTPTGLKNFITQYFTLTSGFTDTRTAADAEAINGKKIQRWLFDIPEKIGGRNDGKADVKVGTTFSGKKPVRAELKDGKLSQQFKDALIAGLNTRMKQVNFSDGSIKGINNPNPLTTVTINSNDVLKTVKHANYNAYVKSFVSTTVYGKHQVKNPVTGKMEHVYAVNGQMHLNPADLLPSAADSMNAREVPGTPNQVNGTEEVHEDPADALFDLSNDSRVISGDVVRHVIKPVGEELTLENLQKLYNFTSEATRNSKTPEEVLTDLREKGIASIAEGYNPFEKC